MPPLPTSANFPSARLEVEAHSMHFRGLPYVPWIDAADPREMDYWSDLLKVDRSELEASVAAAGPAVAAVLRHLGR